MAEQASEFEWRGGGEEAEIFLYAPDDSAFERVLPATRIPGVGSPVYAAASQDGFGWAAASSSHVAPDLFSAPVCGLLLTAEVALGNLGMPPEEVPRLISRNLTEVRLPSLSEAGVRRICESGAYGAAEDGLIEEEDLQFFGRRESEPDSLIRRAISAGTRDWDEPGKVQVYSIEEILDSERAESRNLGAGALAVVTWVGAGELGRLALDAHHQRIADRAESGDFGAEADLPAAPVDTEEADDLLAAAGAASNFADGRAALLLYALRRSLEEVAGALGLRAVWMVGGVEDQDGLLVHRWRLAAVREGEVLVAGDNVAAGAGRMLGSAPAFGVPESEGRWIWEEAGLLERLARMRSIESGSRERR